MIYFRRPEHPVQLSPNLHYRPEQNGSSEIERILASTFGDLLDSGLQEQLQLLVDRSVNNQIKYI